MLVWWATVAVICEKRTNGPNGPGWTESWCPSMPQLKSDLKSLYFEPQIKSLKLSIEYFKGEGIFKNSILNIFGVHIVSNTRNSLRTSANQISATGRRYWRVALKYEYGPNTRIFCWLWIWVDYYLGDFGPKFLGTSGSVISGQKNPTRIIVSRFWYIYSDAFISGPLPVKLPKKI